MSTEKTTKRQQAVCGIITEMNKVILFLLILNLLNTSIIGYTYDGDEYAEKVEKNETEVVIPLKHLRNIWRTLNKSLINCEIELVLTWSKNSASADVTVRAAGNNNDPPAIVAPTGLEFQVTSTKLYVPVVTLSKENNKKILEQLKSGFKRSVKWNKYRSQMTTQSNNNNLNHLIDPTFTKVNKLFVFSFEKIEENNKKNDHRFFLTLLCTKDQNKRFQCFN